jgi:hypothetical protein
MKEGKQMQKQVQPIQAVSKMLKHNALLLRKINSRAGLQANSDIAAAYERALQSPERVKAFLSGLVDEKLLVS